MTTVPPALAAEGMTPESYTALQDARRLVDKVTAQLADAGSPMAFVVACVTAAERPAWGRQAEVLETQAAEPAPGE